MLRGLLALTLVASLCGLGDSLKKNLTVGYLTAVKGTLKGRQGLAVSGAISMAINEVNRNEKLLPNVQLVLKWNDTRGDTVATTRAITDMLCEGVYAIFGPEGTCHVESIIAQARNIPMISYKCSDYRASTVPTFARTEPPNTQVTKSVISLLEYFDWRKFSIIYEDTWSTVAKSLELEAHAKEIRVNHKIPTKDHHTCCENKEDCCHTNFWYNVIQTTKNGTRIYVFLGTADSLREMMSSMKDQELFDRGEYMVIYVDPMPYTSREPMKYLVKVTEDPEVSESPESEKCLLAQPELEKQARSLLVVVSSPPVENYKSFTEEVRKYNNMDPFFFHTPSVFVNNSYVKFVSVYAAYLYDSVILYAKALDHLLKQYPSPLNETVIEEVASNGTKIIETIINRGSYISITGATIKLDKNGDSEGNFSVLAYEYEKLENYSSCYFTSIGQFHHRADNNNPEFKVKNPPNWVAGAKPEDEPSCGFNNERCAKEDTEKGAMIFAVALAIILFCASVSTLSIYRKWKIEQEIEGLLWKIDPSELHGYMDMVSSPSKISLVSATSFESRGPGGQVFASTGHFRGLLVRVKEIKFSRKKDISREVMKEMRLLRDIRHDNINSFIGAVVEPMRILVITDYCSKGSLYDIVENEDIKLDKMFIASLIFDLIKGMIFIHNSQLGVHGNLKSSNCVVTSRWVLQISDFGLHELRHCPESDSIGEHQYYRSLLWTAPELLRNDNKIRGTQKSDVYAFAIILHEIIGRKGPFGACGVEEPKEIVAKVKHNNGGDPFRPSLSIIEDTEVEADLVMEVMADAWAEDPELRPDFQTIRTRLKGLRQGKQRNIMDQMMEMMEKYANNLEDLVNQRTLEVYEEKRKTEDLLHRMLPAPVAKRLTSGYGVEPESFDLVTIYFSDIVGFTAMSAESTPLQVVNFLNDLYTMFDSIIKGYDVYKVETIGDAYMVVSGLPIRNEDCHAGEIASMSLDLLKAVKNYQIAHRPGEPLKLRIGIHTGPVVAGVVGLTMPRYCLFGDTVNTASRMESNGEPLKIHISENCKMALEKLGGYIVQPRGPVNMKGKGLVNTFWLTGATEAAIKPREVDLTDLPPLFCRPRKSPFSRFLQTDSRRQSNAAQMRTVLPPVPETVRGAKSLDVLPLPRNKNLVKRSCHSLQEETGGVCGNGALVNVPLLPDEKRWHSLETVPPEPCGKKGHRTSLRSWIFGLFNNNSYQSSDGSLRKGGYQDLQPERESIV